MNDVTAGQRALWTFLVSTLVGPFLAALIMLVIMGVAVMLGMGPPSLKALHSGQVGPALAERTIQAYVWSAFPAAVAGALAAGWLSLKGTLPWLGAVVLGGVAATIAAVTSGGMAATHVTPIAFIAAVAALGVWLILVRAGIVPSDT